MGKQKEIREGIERIILPNAKTKPMPLQGMAITMTQEIMDFLHSQRCRIEVDRELPDIEDYCQRIQGLSNYSERMSGYREAQKDMAGYTTVEPLIKD